jgi:SAM-dependent methyltransferase
MGFSDHFSTQSVVYAEFRPNYPEEIFAWLSSQCKERNLCWDAATGNGQAAEALAGYFARVYASDGSASQIAAARKSANIEYAVEVAEQTRLAAESCDLVTVAQAYHWFDHAKFHAEVSRVLKPSGVLAVWGYGLHEVTPQIDAVTREYYHDVVGAYWPAERRHVENHYAEIAFPFAEMPTPQWQIRAEYSLPELLGYLESWSATQRYRKENSKDPLALVKTKLAAVWGDAKTRTVRWPIFMRVGRKNHSAMGF